MNDIETRLRDAYRAAAATISPDTTRELGEQTVTISPPAGLASRRGRGRIIIPLAAGAAVALVGALTAVVLPRVLASPHQLGQAAAPVPRFVAQIDGSGRGGLGSLVIRDLATGTSVARIAPPAQGLLFEAIATRDGTHFVADLGRDGGCGAWFYQFQLNGAGQPSALTPYKLASVRSSVTTIALSANNGTFAYLAAPCPNSHSHSQASLSVLSLPAMRTSRWEVPPAVADAFMPLELNANGSLLAYGIIGGWRAGTHVYVLPTSAAPGPALKRSREVATSGQFGRFETILGYAVTADGRSLHVQTRFSESNAAAGHRWQIWVIDIASGRIRFVRQFSRADTQTWTPDWSARHALVFSVILPNTPGAPAPVRFLVINLATGRVLRHLESGPWDPTNSLFSW